MRLVPLSVLALDHWCCLHLVMEPSSLSILHNSFLPNQLLFPFNSWSDMRFVLHHQYHRYSINILITIIAILPVERFHNGAPDRTRQIPHLLQMTIINPLLHRPILHIFYFLRILHDLMKCLIKPTAQYTFPRIACFNNSIAFSFELPSTFNTFQLTHSNNAAT